MFYKNMLPVKVLVLFIILLLVLFTDCSNTSDLFLSNIPSGFIILDKAMRYSKPSMDAESRKKIINRIQKSVKRKVKAKKTKSEFIKYFIKRYLETKTRAPRSEWKKFLAYKKSIKDLDKLGDRYLAQMEKAKTLASLFDQEEQDIK